MCRLQGMALVDGGGSSVASRTLDIVADETQWMLEEWRERGRGV